jgi:hypothetical protein
MRRVLSYLGLWQIDLRRQVDRTIKRKERKIKTVAVEETLTNESLNKIHGAEAEQLFFE